MTTTYSNTPPTTQQEASSSVALPSESTSTSTTTATTPSLLTDASSTTFSREKPKFSSSNEEKAFNEMLQLLEKDRATLTPYQVFYVFDNEPNYHCLVRYLRARDFEVKKAYELLKSTLVWLEEFKPHLITATKIKPEACTGKSYSRGFDKFNRPIVYLTPSKENTYDNTGNIQMTVYSLYTACARMAPDVTQMTWICDFDGYSMKNAPSLSVCKQTVDILSSHFPERLGVALIVNPPRVFSW